MADFVNAIVGGYTNIPTCSPTPTLPRSAAGPFRPSCIGIWPPHRHRPKP
jgi:hypothetical protein